MKEWAIWVSSMVLFCISLNLWGLLDFVNSIASEGPTDSHEPSQFAALLCVAIETYDWTPHYVTVSGSLVN